MFSPEHINRLRYVSFALALGLGSAACSGQDADTTPPDSVPAETNKQLNEADTNFLDFTVNHFYTPSGKRITTYSDISTDWGYLTPNAGYCDGGYLVEMPLQYRGDGGNSVPERTPFAGCDDGKLTPSDFPGEK